MGDGGERKGSRENVRQGGSACGNHTSRAHVGNMPGAKSTLLTVTVGLHTVQRFLSFTHSLELLLLLNYPRKMQCGQGGRGSREEGETSLPFPIFN